MNSSSPMHKMTRTDSVINYKVTKFLVIQLRACEKKSSPISLKQSWINNNKQVVKRWRFIKVNERFNFRLIFRLELNLNSLLMHIKFLYHYVTCILKLQVTWFSLNFFLYWLFNWLCRWKKGWWCRGRCRYGIKLIQLSVCIPLVVIPTVQQNKSNHFPHHNKVL